VEEAENVTVAFSAARGMDGAAEAFATRRNTDGMFQVTLVMVREEGERDTHPTGRLAPLMVTGAAGIEASVIDTASCVFPYADSVTLDKKDNRTLGRSGSVINTLTLAVEMPLYTADVDVTSCCSTKPSTGLP